MIHLDHNIVMQMWQDPFIWEQVPALDPYREEAEAICAEALAEGVSIKVKESWLYNYWLDLFKEWLQDDLTSLEQLVKYIQRKRNFRQEAIVLNLDGMEIDLTLTIGQQHANNA